MISDTARAERRPKYVCEIDRRASSSSLRKETKMSSRHKGKTVPCPVSLSGLRQSFFNLGNIVQYSYLFHSHRLHVHPGQGYLMTASGNRVDYFPAASFPAILPNTISSKVLFPATRPAPYRPPTTSPAANNPSMIVPSAFSTCASVLMATPPMV